ncbi:MULTISPECIES: hypothetical protein [Streptosporangium]|uniref:Uncharacterized protein n=1 Tax=Streptosporangium brasiliense TaxID=47480 RepID=A0ABT9QZB5_9ACTN|nr:hypothetical protein [Streptosporangium brasiliense]MDP9862314.1 hypothetical protein [Streptosporangium brasiliense]
MPRFDFAIEPAWRAPLRLLGVTPERASVLVENGTLTVRFGHWLLRTPVSNIADATLTGPYSMWKVIGPHLSLADRGVTFGTNPRRGVCVRFHTPVPALLPGGLLPHPGATLTVSDPEGLMEALRVHQAHDGPQET